MVALFIATHHAWHRRSKKQDGEAFHSHGTAIRHHKASLPRPPATPLVGASTLHVATMRLEIHLSGNYNPTRPNTDTLSRA
jgi:hypothetical protein